MNFFYCYKPLDFALSKKFVTKDEDLTIKVQKSLLLSLLYIKYAQQLLKNTS